MKSSRKIEKFSCETSRFLLPTFRRPCYREIMTTNVKSDPEADVFSKWTREDGQYYHKINTALLNDDYDVLKENVQFINSLRMVIRKNNQQVAMKVYRGLCIADEHVKQEYKVGLQFLWPTFTCTSKNKEVARGFGNYLFEIDASPDDWSFRADISKYSEFPQEEEVLFYPYTGFVVTNIVPDAKVIQLKCVDTLQVESQAEKQIQSVVKIFDSSRNIFVFLHKDNANAEWCYANEPNKVFIIAANQTGYWDAPYRYHHRNGYFIDKGHNVWEEYHSDQLFSKFSRVES